MRGKTLPRVTRHLEKISAVAGGCVQTSLYKRLGGEGYGEEVMWVRRRGLAVGGDHQAVLTAGRLHYFPPSALALWFDYIYSYIYSTAGGV